MGNQYDFSSKEELVQSFVVNPDGTIVSDGRKIEVAAKGDPGRTPQKGIDYFDGDDGIGIPPDHEWEGTKLRFQNPDGFWETFVNLKGDKGDDGYTPKKGVDYRDGEPGKTPVKGVDYRDGEDGHTPVKGEDYDDGKDGAPGVEPEEMARIRIDLGLMKDAIAEMKQIIADVKARVAQVKDGDAGYTPKKGVDYNDGKDGYTPIKDVDYRDGEDAKIPESVTMTVITDVKLINGALSVKRQDVKIYLKD